MNLLFTRNNKLGSRVIRGVSGDDVSHVAVEWLPGIVSHMTFTHGYGMDELAHFAAEHEIVYTITLDVPSLVARDRLEAIRQKNRQYDFPGLIWLGILLLWRRLTGYQITRNHWQKPWLEMCTEFATQMAGEKPNSIVTPGELYRYLKEKQDGLHI